MRLVLDSNEFIYAIGPSRLPASTKLLDLLVSSRQHSLRIHRTIVNEVCRNLPGKDHGAFFGILDVLLDEACGIDEEFVVPQDWQQRYLDLGFKPGDAHIGAYAEVVEAEVLISENRRHFHALADRLPFGVMDAAQFLKRHSAAR